MLKNNNDKKIAFTVEQVKRCFHTLGLSAPKVSYRNRYYTGRIRCPHLDELVEKKLMTRQDDSMQMGGTHYHMTDKGIELFKYIFENFKIKHD